MPAESYLGFNTFVICPPAFPPPSFSKASMPLLFFLNRAVTHLIGFAFHDNASLRCFKIEKWLELFLIPRDSDNVKVTLMHVSAALEESNGVLY